MLLPTSSENQYFRLIKRAHKHKQIESLETSKKHFHIVPPTPLPPPILTEATLQIRSPVRPSIRTSVKVTQQIETIEVAIKQKRLLYIV